MMLEMILHEGGDEIVAVVITLQHAQAQCDVGLGAGSRQVVRQ